MSFHDSRAHFFSGLNNIPLSGCTIVYLFIHLLKDRGFPGGSDGKESTYNVGYLGSIPGLGGFPGEEKGYPLWYSGLENSMDFIAHVVTKSQT